MICANSGQIKNPGMDEEGGHEVSVLGEELLVTDSCLDKGS